MNSSPSNRFDFISFFGCYVSFLNRRCRLLVQDSDGLGKRRLDNGEVGRWKITDDPPPSKKKPPSLDEARQDGHKRKKEKEMAQESGPKKKVSESQNTTVFQYCLLSALHPHSSAGYEGHCVFCSCNSEFPGSAMWFRL